MSDILWKEAELAHLQELWNVRPKMPAHHHTREKWNERAHKWEQELRENQAREERSRRRVEATARYLIRRGVLTEDTAVIDIGCGPGRFVAEFAKTAKQSDGLDISDQMTGYGWAFCREAGLDNVSFYDLDFKTMDPAEQGMEEKYDLVFSSITPAVGNKAGYEKAMAMSKGWFFNANFVTIRDTLQTALEEKLGFVPARSRDGAGFYCMMNELLLKGYYPELTYYSEQDVDYYDIESAYREYSNWFFREGPDGQQERAMKEALASLADENGRIRAEKEWVYAWLLVDKQNRNVHENNT